MEIVETHRSPLNRQVHEGVELDTNGADVILNSKSEWNHCRIPRIVIEVGDEVEEDGTCGMVRSTELGGKERSDKRIRVKPQEKRQIEETGSRGHKRQRMGEVSRVGEESGTAEPRQENKRQYRGASRTSKYKKGNSDREELESGERLRGLLEAYGVVKRQDK